FSEALRWEPTNNAPRLALAQIELDAAEYGKAVASADEALVYRPDDAAARLVRAAGLLGLKKFDEARLLLNAMLASHPKNADALFQLGALEAATGRWKEAAEAYHKCY